FAIRTFPSPSRSRLGRRGLNLPQGGSTPFSTAVASAPPSAKAGGQARSTGLGKLIRLPAQRRIAGLEKRLTYRLVLSKGMSREKILPTWRFKEISCQGSSA